MLVSNWMTKEPITVTPDDFLINAKEKMEAGKFHVIWPLAIGLMIGALTARWFMP